MRKLVATALLAALSTPLWAALQTVTLSVPGMNCAACPITVSQALKKVPGVRQVAVDLERREATVRFDAAQAPATALLRATRDAGYPSTVREATR